MPTSCIEYGGSYYQNGIFQVLVGASNNDNEYRVIDPTYRFRDAVQVTGKAEDPSYYPGRNLSRRILGFPLKTSKHQKKEFIRAPVIILHETMPFLRIAMY